MIDIPVLDTEGREIRRERLDPEILGGRVRHALLKQAIVAFRAAQRQGTVGTRSRGMVHGASRKLYRQKGTGRARMGNLRTPIRRGGGRTFAKTTRDMSVDFPRQMRRLARNSAILAKAQAGSIRIVDGLKFDAPKTATFARMMRAIGADRGLLLAVPSPDVNLWKSARNIPDAVVRTVSELNAYEVLRYRQLVFVPEAFATLTSDPRTAGAPAKA